MPVNDQAGVVIPLEDAHLHSHSYRQGRAEYEELSDGGESGDSAETASDEESGMLEMNAAEYSIQGLRKEVRRGGGGRRWTSYEIQSKLINKAIQDIGMGTYNWQLFALCGFGWFADNLWMQGVSLTLPSLSAEFGVSEKSVRYTTSSVYLGLCFGSFFWGLGSDILGRRIAFNLTLLITSIFGIALSYAPSWGGTCVLYAALGFGVGGNLPVDGALFLEFLPDSSSSLLTLLSVWWPVGQLVSSLIAWFFISNWPADQGWRYFVLTIGLITFAMFAIRYFALEIFESPKYLLSRGRQAEAIAVVHGVARRNNRKTWLTESIMDAVVDEDVPSTLAQPLAAATTNAIREKLASLSGDRIRPLFGTRKLGLATTTIWLTWATIGMGYPLFNAFLPQYLSHGGALQPDGPSAKISGDMYRNYAITSIVGVPGSLLACYTVDKKSPFLGRRGTLAISTVVSAVFLFFFVRFGQSAGLQLFFSCVEAFAQNIMYGVLYSYTPEVFPAPVRGTGTGVASFLNRVTGLIAPVIAANLPGDGASTPIYLSAALILAAFVAICMIPIETRGRQRL